MFNDEISKFNKIVVYKDGVEYNIPNIDSVFKELLEYSYFTSSLAIADNNTMVEQKKKGIWIELEYSPEMTYKDNRFEKLLISIKPKYEYINLYRYYDKEYQGRCFGLSLGIKTTDLYNHIIGEINSGR